MSHEPWLEQLDIYAVGALDGEELSQFEAHLKGGCPLCQRHLQETHEALTLMPKLLPKLQPPAAIKARLLEQIGPPPSAPPSVNLLGLWLSGAVLAIAAVVIIIQGSNLSFVRNELKNLTVKVGELRAKSSEQEQIQQLLAAPEIRLVDLDGLAASPNARGRLLWNPVTQSGVLLTTGLPPAEKGSVYELWAIAGETPVPAGLFTVDSKGQGTLKLPKLPRQGPFQAFAVTLEPAGGVSKPTGAMHLLGKLP